MRSGALLAAWSLLTLFSAPSQAAVKAPGTAAFALIVGTNQPMDEDLAPLQYADDDAARYFDLFSAIGARPYLLTRFDESTARLHPDAARMAHRPREADFAAVLGLLRGDIAEAKAKGQTTVLYFVYAGHGSVDNGKGYITLEDGRLFGDDLLDRVVKPMGADHMHLIVDACHSYFLAYDRGAGGARRSAEGFSKMATLADGRKVGLILSTSSAAESHEWDAFQAGVFSHEVRSGLYGAADADQDGRITYRELAAFVDTANGAIPNQKYRPQLHARAPANDSVLVDLRDVKAQVLEIDGGLAARYFVETESGVRLADFHNAPGVAVRLLRPREDVLFVRSVDEDVEYEVVPMPGTVRLSAFSPRPPSARGRGAAHHAFSLVFAETFGPEDVAAFEFSSVGGVGPAQGPGGLAFTGVGLLISAAAVGAAGAAMLGGAFFIAQSLEAGVVPWRPGGMGPTGEDAATANAVILGLDVAGVVAVAAGALTLATGATLLLWPVE